MANTCCTDMRITAPEADLDRLESEFDKALRIKCPESGPWLGKLFMHLGATFQEAMDGAWGRCCGGIEIVRRASPTELIVDLTSKWQPHLKAVRDFILRYAPGAGIHYYGCEPTDEIYWTDVPGLIFAGTDEEPGGPTQFLDEILYFTTKNTVKDVLSKNLQSTGSIDELIDELYRRYKITLTLDDTQLVPLDDVCD